jgi:hypothetical protein
LHLAFGKKVSDPDTGLGKEYQKEKIKEKMGLMSPFAIFR